MALAEPHEDFKGPIFMLGRAVLNLLGLDVVLIRWDEGFFISLFKMFFLILRAISIISSAVLGIGIVLLIEIFSRFRQADPSPVRGLGNHQNDILKRMREEEILDF